MLLNYKNILNVNDMLNATKKISAGAYIADIVNNDYRTARVFRKHSIDFCCGGKLSLQAACGLKGIDEGKLLKELQYSDSVYENAQEWPTGFLIDYIVNIHHVYFKDNMPVVQDYIDRFVLNHFKKYPGIQQLPAVAEQLCNKLTDLIKFESDTLFPYIKQIVHAYNNNEAYGRLFIKTMCKLSAEDIKQHHAQTEVFILQIENITSHFLLPENICITHKVMLRQLQEFIAYIKQHLFIEDDILIPATLLMEKSLLDGPAQ